MNAPRKRECLSAIVASGGDHFQPVERLTLIASSTKVSDSPSAAQAQLAIYGYLGDMALRLVFRDQDCIDSPVRLEEIARLELTPERALALATVNFKRINGPAEVRRFAPGVHALWASNPDAYAGYLLDRTYWRSQLKRYAQGVLVALPRPGNVLFASAADTAAAQELKRLAAQSYHAADEHGLSAYLYRFDAEGWHVHERLPEAPAGKTSMPAPRLKDTTSRDTSANARRLAARQLERDEEEREESLSLAAKGQKMVIHSIFFNLGLGGLERNHALPAMVLLALYVGIAVYALIGVVRMCSGLNQAQGQKISFMVLTFFPLVNLMALVYLSCKITARLRQAGWRVGLLGVSS